MGQTSDAKAAALASAQSGCIARRQALDLGTTDRMIARRLAAGTWVRGHPGVYRLTAAPTSWLQEVWAAVLAVGPDVIASHETALLLTGASTDERVARRPVVLTSPHGRHHRVAGAVVHQFDDVRPHHVCQVDGLVVSLPARAVVDIAATAGLRKLSRLVDDLIVDRKITTASLAACLYELRRPGKPGVAKLASILDDRGDGYVPPHSELERLLFIALRDAGLPPPVRQIPLPGRGALEGLADAGYPDTRLLIEADGRRWHTRQKAFATDRERDAEAARVGWQTLRFAYEQITSDPRSVAATIADVRRTRLLQLCPDNAAA